MKNGLTKALALTGLVLGMMILTWLMFAAIFAEAPDGVLVPAMIFMKIGVLALYVYLAWWFLKLIDKCLEKKKPPEFIFPKKGYWPEEDVTSTHGWKSDPRD